MSTPCWASNVPASCSAWFTSRSLRRAPLGENTTFCLPAVVSVTAVPVARALRTAASCAGERFEFAAPVWSAAALVLTRTGVGELLVPVSTPVSVLVPETVVMVPPISEAAIWAPVGAATPRAIKFWRAVSSRRAASPAGTAFDGVKVTICREPSAPTVASVTAVPLVRPDTRLSKLPVEPANGMSWGATNCTCCVDGENVALPEVFVV